jgi:hypothetical protein
MATFKSVVITAKNHIKTDGTTNIKICVYHNGIAKHLKTPYYIEPEFMTKAGLIKDSHP